MPGRSGFKILKLFHPSAVVEDIGELSDFYRHVFGVQTRTIPFAEMSFTYRSFALIADAWIENMCPEPSHLSQIRMHNDIIGNHWFFPAFYVSDMQDAIHTLHARHRFRLTQSGNGNAIQGMPVGWPGRTLCFTHPRDTGIMWELWEGEDEIFQQDWFGADPRMRKGWTLEAPAKDDPLGVERVSHLTVVVHDKVAILKFLVDICRGEIFDEKVNREQGSEDTWVSVGEDRTIIEIAQPTAPGPRQSDLHKANNSMHCLNFKVLDLNSARKHLLDKGQKLEVDTDRLLVTDPATSLGLRFGFVSALHEKDPRGK